MKKSEMIKKAKEMRSSGMKWIEIGSELGIHPATICKAVVNSRGGERFRTYSKRGPTKTVVRKKAVQKPKVSDDDKILWVKVILSSSAIDSAKIKAIQGMLEL